MLLRKEERKKGLTKMGKEFLTGSGDWGYDAYFQAVTEGMVNPKEVNFKLFLSKSDHKRISLSDKTDEYSKEVVGAAKDVSNLFKSGRGRVVKKWFGEEVEPRKDIVAFGKVV